MMKLKTYFVSTRAILVPVLICCAIYSDRSETILAKQIALIQPMFSQMSSRRTVFFSNIWTVSGDFSVSSKTSFPDRCCCLAKFSMKENK